MAIKKLVFIFISFLLIFTGCSTSTEKEELKEKKIEKVVNKTPEKKMTVAQKKQYFKDVLVPIATEVYNELESQYLAIKSDIKNKKNRKQIEKLKKTYRARTDELLLHALKPHPISILLAQAAAESAWLTSRFTKDANNIFGVWSFNKQEPRIAASGLRGDKTIYLKKYKNLKEAVRDYYKNLGKNWAYKEFRKQRTLTSNPYVLSDYLTSYSEKKEKYTKLLRSMIKYNKFEKYDIKSDILYTQYIEKKPIIEKIVKNSIVIKDTNQTNKLTEVNKIIQLKKEIKVKDTNGTIKIQDINSTKLNEKLQSDS